MDYRIAIPSYARPEAIKDKTLHMLDQMSVDRDRILVVCATPEEKERYDASLGNGWRTEVAELGVPLARAWYHRYFPEGTRIISVDDDIEGLYQKSGVKLIPYAGSIDDLVEDGFSQCEAAGAKLWGVYPVFNGMFMNDQTVVGLRFICAAFFGSYAGDPIFQDRHGSDGEDWESTLRSFISYNKVVRLEYVTFKTRMWQDVEGGISQEVGGLDNRMKLRETSLQDIATRYPQLVSTYRKAGNILNLRLKSIDIAKIPRDNIAEFVRAMKGRLA